MKAKQVPSAEFGELKPLQVFGFLPPAGPAVRQHRMALEATTTVLSFRARDGIFELRRLTGFTWDELALLLSVTRRSLHLWANGGPINTPNEKRVRDLLVTMRKLDRGNAAGVLRHKTKRIILDGNCNADTRNTSHPPLPYGESVSRS